MTELDTPAIGRKIAYLHHHDRPALIKLLSAAPRHVWQPLALAYVTHIGQTCDAVDRDLAVPGVLYIWEQLVKEANT
jgi:hypothetical protein